MRKLEEVPNTVRIHISRIRIFGLNGIQIPMLVDKRQLWDGLSRIFYSVNAIRVTCSTGGDAMTRKIEIQVLWRIKLERRDGKKIRCFT